MMTRITKSRLVVAILLLLVVAVGVTACGSAPASAPAKIKTASPQEIASRLPGALDDGMILLDVRTPEEWVSDGFINGATLLPLQQLQDSMDSELPDKDAEIVVYCRSGNRSRQAAEILVNAGYTNVTDLGGIQQWVAAGLTLTYEQ